MNEQAPDKYTLAAAEYYQFRRNYWRCRVGGFACAGGGVLLNIILNPWNERLSNGLSALLSAAFVVCLVWGVTAFFSLRNFRCPRCGRQDNWPSLWDGWPEATCKHCQLPARPRRHY